MALKQKLKLINIGIIIIPVGCATVKKIYICITDLGKGGLTPQLKKTKMATKIKPIELNNPNLANLKSPMRITIIAASTIKFIFYKIPSLNQVTKF